MRPSRTTVAAFACAALVALLYASPVLPAVARTGLDWPIWITHSEGLCNTSYGKWWVLPPHRPLVDGSSGEFPTYYQNLSDALVILIAELGGWPAITVQAVFYAPALAFAFLFANYLSIAAVVRDSRVALWASLLISLGGNSTFVDRYDALAHQPLERVLHVPFHSLPVATAQSLGWVLLLPCLALTHLVYRGFTRRRAIATGLVLAVLFYAHSMTFVNAVAVQLAYLVLANATERPRDRRFALWALALGGLVAAFLYLAATRPVMPFVGLVSLGLLALVATFLLDPEKRFYLWTYLPAAGVALPYLLVLARHARAVLAVQDAWSQVQTTAVSGTGVLLFFLGYLLAAGVACFFYRDRSVLLWLAAMLGATLFLALNHVWRWNNHSYRYAINLIFPLGILAALALRHGPKPLALGAGAWLGLVCALDVSEFAAGKRPWVDHRVAEPERAAFLRTVRETTAPHEGTGLRILNPPELSYARGIGQAAMLMNYSRIRAFVPDYRFVLWRERYYNRMGLFCFLFPGYPNADFPFGRRACEEELDPDRELAEIVDPRIKTAILPLYSIGFAGAPAKPFASFLKDARLRYGWPTIVETDSATLLRTDVAPLPGVARLGAGDLSDSTLRVEVEITAPGAQLVVLGGRKLAERAPRITLDGRVLENGRGSANWAVFAVDLAKGAHTLELPSLVTGPEPEADYLYFAAVVQRDHANRYLRFGNDATGPAAAGR